MLIDINKLTAKDRIRKDFGDIEELAEDIKENGLINPPVVTPEFELIAGERRLRAMKHLGYQQLEVRVMKVNDFEHMLNLEINENESRKDFTKSERINYARQLEQIERMKAKERMGQGCQNSDELGRVDEMVAKKLDIGSRDTYRKEKYIAENADKETLKQWDDKDISTHKAYITIKKEKKQLEEKNKEIEQAIQEQKKMIDMSEKDKEKLRQENKELKNRKPKTVEIPVPTVPMDYEHIKESNAKLEYKITELSRLVEDKNIEIENATKNKEIFERKAKLNEEDSKKYKQLKDEIENLSKEKDDLGRQIKSRTELSGLVVRIEHILKTELAPIKYSRAIDEASTDEVVTRNLRDIVSRVEAWCEDMYEYIPEKKGNENIIDVEVIEHE